MQMILFDSLRTNANDPAEAISAATINAAYSLDGGSPNWFSRSCKQADAVIFDCSDYRQIPYLFGSIMRWL